MHGGKTNERAAAVRVKVRSALAHEIRQIKQTVAADRRTRRLLIHQIIRVYAHAGCGLFFRAAEVIAEPLKGQTRALRHAHHVPCARYGAAERVHAALRINGNIIRVRKHNAGGADGCKRLAVLHNAGTHGCCRIIARAADHDGARRKAGALCGFFGDDTRHFRGFVYLRQECLVNIKLFKHFVAPAAIRHV